MKIVYLIAGTYRPAGMERVLANKVNWLAGRGYEVTVVTTDQRGRKPAFPLDSSVGCVDLGINYESDNGRSFLRKALLFPLRLVRHRTRLSALLKRMRPDITVSMFCNDASFVPKIKDGSRKVLEVHFSRYKRLQYGRGGIWGLADRALSRKDERTARRFDRFVVLTEEDAGYWNVPGLVVIPNSPACVFAEPAALEGGIVLAVGRYCRQKNFDSLVRAWSGIPEKVREGWKLRIAGDGEDREQLEELAGSLGLGGSVVLGPESNMIDYYRKASVLALSSRYEGLPMVLLEAQAAGLPIVSYDCKCGPKDVVEDGVDGFLVPEGREDMLAQRLASLMEDGDLRRRMGAAAYKASGRFEEGRIMERWVGLFEGLCRG